MVRGADTDLGFRMHAERTPNPNSLKWVLARPILPGGVTASFESPPPRGVSPLAADLFSLDGVVGVFLAANFVTVSKADAPEWLEIAQTIVDVLKAHLESGEPVLGDAYEAPPPASHGDVATRICSVIDEQIRPGVARDGGDVVFARYRDGVVELQMRGACSGCPSATATLKLAIEARLREEVPEVREVVAV